MEHSEIYSASPRDF